MFVGAKHAVGQAMIFVKHAEHLVNRLFVSRVARKGPPHSGGFKALALLTHECPDWQLYADLASEVKFAACEFPIFALGVEFPGQSQQALVAGTIVEPKNTKHFVLPAIDGPFLQGGSIDVSRPGRRNISQSSGMTRVDRRSPPDIE